MDPLSITASTLTVLTALETASQLIKSYRDAPGQWEALKKEISDVTATVRGVARVIKDNKDKVDTLSNNGSHLTLALSNIREKAQELKSLLRSCVISSSSPSIETKISRISWLKVRSKVQILQAELRDGRLNLSIALATFTASSSLRVELNVRDVLLIAHKTSLDQQQLQKSLTEERDQRRLAQDQTCAQVLTQLERLQLQRRETGHYLTDDQVKPETLVDNLQDAQKTDEHGGPVAQAPFPLVVPVNSSPRSDFRSEQVSHWDSIRVRADLVNVSTCSRSCICSCHKHRRLSTPRLLDRFLGTLFIGYSGSPLLSQKCDQIFCCGQKNSSTTLIYQFPRWFVISRLIQLKAIVTAMYGPELSLRFNRVVDGKALVFYYATTGDVSKMKRLFEQGRASPSDVRFDSGWTPFHYAIQNNQVDVCRLLLQAGGDPYVETEAPTTAVDYAGAKILGSSVKDSVINNLRELFFDSQFLEHGKLSGLHKIILQICPGSIRDELQKSTAMLDTTDSTGRSPLSWASQKGEAGAVRVLLEHGADPNKNDNTNMTPLHYAAQADTPDCLLLLLAYGARLTQQTRGWTALHYACAYHDELSYVRPLLDHGAEIDKRTYVGKTALSLSIVHDHLKVATLLIKIGADIDVLDKGGVSPLALSFQFRRLEAMKLLLRYGATHKVVSEGDDTMLHLVAKFPDLRIIKYLSQCNLGDVDLDAKNKDGLTACECIQLQNTDSKIALAFQRLLTRTKSKTETMDERSFRLGTQDPWESDSTTEIFEDAVEE
ncbi:hypothetical protein N7G274_009259 [Stereocaulon virgatum]|uniref:Ankyrin n=1 Tax=Stereocaulon virgatum TaxID=373712 RepID=A0ABR3ZWM2_9LECA